jgi:hypothetical protein
MTFTGVPIKTSPPRVSILAQQVSGTSSLALSSSTPGLPFLGNPLAVVSYVRNSALLANATAAFEVGLRRQSDCSLAEDFVWPDAATPNTPDASFITSLPAAQDYFHKLSGLATTPDVFAKGIQRLWMLGE